MNAHRQRLRASVAVAALALTGGLLAATSAQADNVVGSTAFELDRNAADGAASGDDWSTLFSGNGGSTARTGIIADPANATIFTTGGSKDDLDITSWRHTAGSVPDKDEILNAYAAAYSVADGSDTGTDPDLVVFFGSDRLAQNGSSNVGFWFTRQRVAPEANGTFGTSVHEDGDTLVLSEFTNGGAVSGIQVWEWFANPSGPTCSNTPAAGCVDNDGNLKLLLTATNADCTTALAAANACATVNNTAIPVPWTYKAKGPTAAGTIPVGGFIEGGLNLSALNNGARPCFSNFLAETRSSPAVDATLKDFVRGDFPLCGANVSITGADVNEVNESHTFTVTANEVFGGVSSPASVAHVDVTLTSANGATPVVNTGASTCDNAGDNVDANGQCTIVFNSATTGTVTGTATATVTISGNDFTVSTSGTGGNSGPVIKRYVDSKITLTPLTDTNGIGENHVVTADVEVDLGDGAGWVAATDGHVDAKLTDTLGASSTVNGTGTTCHVNDPPDASGADNLDNSGQCTVAFTSNTSGRTTVHATVNLSVTTDQGNELMTRSTGGSGDFADARKDFVDGSLTWIKRDGDGNLLGGATFQVCRTHNWSSATSSYVDITPDVCVSVLDNSAPDTDSDAGEFKLEDLVLGRYTVHETAAPAGYQIDPDTESADLSVTSPNGSIATAFVNPKLYKLIVITCNTTTETLEDSTVDMGGTLGKKETIKPSEVPAGITQAQLCGLAGANYDNLPAGTYNPSVELPDKAPLFP